MTEVKVISTTQYAKLKGVSRQYIQKLLQKGQSLPGVKYYYKSGGKTSHYILILED